MSGAPEAIGLIKAIHDALPDEYGGHSRAECIARTMEAYFAHRTACLPYGVSDVPEQGILPDALEAVNR